MLQPSLQKNDKKAKWLIAIFSVIVFAAVTVIVPVAFTLPQPPVNGML